MFSLFYFILLYCTYLSIKYVTSNRKSQQWLKTVFDGFELIQTSSKTRILSYTAIIGFYRIVTYWYLFTVSIHARAPLVNDSYSIVNTTFDCAVSLSSETLVHSIHLLVIILFWIVCWELKKVYQFLHHIFDIDKI